MSDPFGGPAPPPGGPPRSTPLGGQPSGFPSGPQPGFGAPPPGHGARPPGYGQPPVAQPQWSQPAGQQGGTNGLAIAAFVLGLLWLCTIGSLLGIIFGFVGLAQIKSSNQKGRGLAIAGIVLGVVGIVATIAITVIVVNKAEDVLDEVPGERDDVSVVGCESGAGGQAEAQLSITNDSSKPSSYLITVLFREQDGRTTLGTATVGAVEPGDTVSATVSADRAINERYDCELSYVNRFASGGPEES